jgi:Spx/MgsR family transcriptional regulator
MVVNFTINKEATSAYSASLGGYLYTAYSGLCHNHAMYILYGIPNCDTVKKARTWLTEQGVDYQFHDFKKQGVTAELLTDWLQTLDWQTLVNRKGTTWRKLDEAVQKGVIDNASACALMLAQPSVIKRPVLQWADGRLSVGFSAEAFASHLKS